MQRTIFISDYTNIAFGKEEADLINPIIDEQVNEFLNEKNSLIFDFSRVKIFTTHFFYHSFIRLMELMPVEVYEEKIKLINLNPIGQVIYDKCFEQAKQYYKNQSNSKSHFEQIIAAFE